MLVPTARVTLSVTTTSEFCNRRVSDSGCLAGPHVCPRDPGSEPSRPPVARGTGKCGAAHAGSGNSRRPPLPESHGRVGQAIPPWARREQGCETLGVLLAKGR